MSRPHVLLTGGAGYVGSHTFVAMARAGYDVTILDDFSTSRRDVVERMARLAGRSPEVVEGSVLDRALLARVFGQRRFDGIVHLVGRKSVAESILRPLEYFDINVSGLVCVMRAAEAAGTTRLVFSSSATVYGESAALPLREDAPLNHTSPYAHTKMTAERVLAQCAAASDWTVGVLRFFNPAGAHPSGLLGEDPRGVPTNLMPCLGRVAQGLQPRLLVYGGDYDTPDGTCLRDYIHVVDLARAHVASMDALLEGRSHVANVSTGTPTSVLAIRDAYARASGRAIPTRIVARRPGDVARLYADPGHARRELGFEATLTLDDMCRDGWNWFLHHGRDAADGRPLHASA